MNTSPNATLLKLAQNYAFLPVDLTFKIGIYTILGLLGIYAVVFNGLVLHFKRTQRLTRKRHQRSSLRAFDRFNVIASYVQSLALSDLLCGAITIPLAICTNFVDFIDTDNKCKVIRYCNIVLPVVTVMNLVVISAERYIAIFHPLQVPSSQTIRRIIVGAWVIGGLLSVVPTMTYRLKRVDVDQDTYTLLCVNDNTSLVDRQIFMGFAVLVYVIPFLLLIALNSRIALFLRRRRKIRSNGSTNWRFYGAKTFVFLMFSFVIPYSLYFVHNFITLVLKLKFSFQVEFVLRRLKGCIAYANSAVNPTLLLYTMKDLRTMFKNLLTRDRSLGSPARRRVDNRITNIQLMSVSMRRDIIADTNNHRSSMTTAL